jgi:predicted N-acyltransferase
MGYAVAEDYVIRVANSPLDVDAAAWDALLQTHTNPSPFMRHAYLAAMHESTSACAKTGWKPHFFTLHADGMLAAACAIYEKNHSRGEYVFDWAWANAYAQHGLPYYPKAVGAVPFTPVPGARLMARTDTDRSALLQAVLQWCTQSGMSSLHLLFIDEADAAACEQAGLMLRHTVQFHWKNTSPGYASFDAFLATLSQEKRKKIRQERRKVADAGVSFRWAQGRDITRTDWDFFYHCYERTYLEHGNAPYLNRDFFQRMADTMPDHWLLFTAEREGNPIATSLIAIDVHSVWADGKNDQKNLTQLAYGRYWGALERVDCLHFEACYYQPLQWCIEHGYQRFEGGAQGEHKMARALLPVRTTSAHWLAHPAFADAVARFLEREGDGISNYLDDLEQRSPFKRNA